jgi:hypothetical protein
MMEATNDHQYSSLTATAAARRDDTAGRVRRRRQPGRPRAASSLRDTPALRRPRSASQDQTRHLDHSDVAARDLHRPAGGGDALAGAGTLPPGRPASGRIVPLTAHSANPCPAARVSIIIKAFSAGAVDFKGEFASARVRLRRPSMSVWRRLSAGLPSAVGSPTARSAGCALGLPA